MGVTVGGGKARLSARFGTELRADWTRRSVGTGWRAITILRDRWSRLDCTYTKVEYPVPPPMQVQRRLQTSLSSLSLSSPSPSGLKSLHLLRALLREASYLPDANARTYFRRYIVNRFRAYQPQDNASPSLHAQAVEKYRHGFGRRRHQSIIDERTRLMQRKARKGLNYLRLATSGDFRCLLKILYFTYGRIGTRKYVLLERLLQPDDPTSLQEPSPLQKLYYSNERCLSFFDAPVKKKNTHWAIHISNRYSKLSAALNSQYQNGVALGRELKRNHFLTPINNIWERPMPIKRARGNVRRWYAETMTRLLPPLPADEFDDIQQMAKGTKRPILPKRRSPALDLHLAEEPSEADRFGKLVHDALALEKPAKVDQRVAGHTPNLRLMKRLYIALLTVCSKLEWNDDFKKWNAVWGSRLLDLNAQFNAGAADLFAGVNTSGKVLKEHLERRRDAGAEKRKAAERAMTSEKLEEYQRNRPKKEQYSTIPFYVDYLPADHPIRKAADAVLSQSPSGAATPPPAVTAKPTPTRQRRA